VLVKTEGNQETAAAKAGMDAKTARKYRRLGQLPSELPAAPRWRNRPDPFIEVWGEVRELLNVNAGLEAKTVFEYLQRRYLGQFADGQLRTLQRRVKSWRATEGPAKEVFFAQQHPPGRLGASDFTHMEELHERAENIMISGAEVSRQFLRTECTRSLNQSAAGPSGVVQMASEYIQGHCHKCARVYTWNRFVASQHKPNLTWRASSPSPPHKYEFQRMVAGPNSLLV